MTDFAEELEVFRSEEEEAQQQLFAYLALRNPHAGDRKVLAAMNQTPLFWITARHALLSAAFICLDRIFDQDQRSDHNIDKLMRVTGDSLTLFKKQALAARKVATGQITQHQADRCIFDAHELTAADVRELRKHVSRWRKIYEDHYRDVRHFVFAHKHKWDTVEQALQKTNVEEMKQMFGFLSGLHQALDQLFLNGRKPVIDLYSFSLPPVQDAWRMSPGERIYAETNTVLRVLAAKLSPSRGS
jgi:hypothetical protein